MLGARSDVAVRGDSTAASGVARSRVGDLGGGGQRRTPRVANEAIVAGKSRGAEGRRRRREDLDGKTWRKSQKPLDGDGDGEFVDLVLAALLPAQ